MILNNQRMQGAIAGGIGGAVSWLLIEPLIAPRLERVSSLSELYTIDIFFGALAGVCIGAALGIAEGLILGSMYRARRGGLIGAGVGIIGGAIGLVFGEMVYQPLQCLCFVGRSLGWAVFGGFLGAAEGITRRSWKGLRSATLGGMIGGAIGGFMFDLVGLFTILLFGSDGLSRAVALTITGACIGLWIALLERVLAPATLKIISGRFEGREFLLDKPTLTLGSNERGDIAIFGDAQIEGHHATLHYENDGYVMQTEGTASISINKQPITRQALHHENIINIGQTRLIYRHKKQGAAARFAGAPPISYQAPSAPPMTPQPPPYVPQVPVVPPKSTLTPSVTPPFAPTPSSAPATWWLVEQRTSRRYAMQQTATTIGRNGHNDIVLDVSAVSGSHAEIRHENGRYIIYDKGSSNGTFVNGRRIAGANMLKAGWAVRIGTVELMVVQ